MLCLFSPVFVTVSGVCAASSFCDPEFSWAVGLHSCIHRAELVDHDTTPPLTGKRRDPEFDSESSDSPKAPSADSLAIVPVTPDDGHAQGLRHSLREHKKPRPYYSAAEPQPPDKLPASKGLQRGFIK
ncbi:hypothetical protein ABBQ38_001310 [Trebouxia sp. C0009 RCD-2024]